MDRLKILVVDDDESQLDAAGQQLGSEHEVLITQSYIEAMRFLKPETGIQALLTNLLMPAEGFMLDSHVEEQFQGLKIPVGLALLFRAAKVGVPYAAALTLMPRDFHPMTSALDWVMPPAWKEGEHCPFRLNDTIILLAHAKSQNGHKDWEAALQLLMTCSSVQQ